MSFDVASTALASTADSGAFMPLLDSSGKVVLAADSEDPEKKVPQGFYLRSRFSRAVIEKQREMATARLELSRRGKELTPELFEQESDAALAAATAGWTFTHLDDKPFPYSYENALALWSDPRFRHLREAANNFVSDIGNFTKR